MLAIDQNGGFPLTVINGERDGIGRVLVLHETQQLQRTYQYDRDVRSPVYIVVQQVRKCELVERQRYGDNLTVGPRGKPGGERLSPDRRFRPGLDLTYHARRG